MPLPLHGDSLDQAMRARPVCRPGLIPRPASQSSIRLPPLEASCESPAGGHLGMLRSMRRSPSFTRMEPERCESKGAFHSEAAQQVQKRRTCPVDRGAWSTPDVTQVMQLGKCPEEEHAPRAVAPSNGPESDDAMRAKAKVIAACQKLFFEELARSGQDATSAAVAVLLRFSENRSELSLAQAPPKAIAPEPERVVPRKPTSNAGRRRPTMIQVAVRS